MWRETILGNLTAFDEKVINHNHNVHSIAGIFKKSIKSDVPIKITVGKNIDAGIINLVATYEAFDVISEKPQIEIVVLSDYTMPLFKLAPSQWSYCKNLFVDVIEHEYTHHDQYNKRDYLPQREVNKKEKAGAKKHAIEYDINYYGNPDELEAFAKNACFELINNCKKESIIKKLLRNYSNLPLWASPIIHGYNEVFEKDSIVMKKFMKRIFRNLNENK